MIIKAENYSKSIYNHNLPNSAGGESMTTINCSFNCKHQQDGKCALENAVVNLKESGNGCIFFDEISRQSRSETLPDNENEFLRNQRL
jgi:hypothetical protein